MVKLHHPQRPKHEKLKVHEKNQVKEEQPWSTGIPCHSTDAGLIQDWIIADFYQKYMSISRKSTHPCTYQNTLQIYFLLLNLETETVVSWTTTLIKTRCYFWSLITICMSTLNYLITDHYHKHYQLLGSTNAVVGRTDYTNRRIRFQNLKERSQWVGWYFGSSKEI